MTKGGTDSGSDIHDEGCKREGFVKSDKEGEWVQEGEWGKVGR